MSNRIIVIDECEHCPFVTLYSTVLADSGVLFRKLLSCKASDNRECPPDGVPDWCPLPEIPERENTVSTYKLRQFAEEKGISGAQANGWKQGWNACLDEIEGGNEDEQANNHT